jgi:hypothetical protein
LAGIRFISVAHEQGGGHMADGYSRVGPAWRMHRAEWPGIPIRDIGGCVLGAFAGRLHHAEQVPERWDWRVPETTTADLSKIHKIPGACKQQGADGGLSGPGI